MWGGHSPSSNSRAGLWAQPQPPGLAALARRWALGGTLEPCCPLAAFSGESAAATGEALRAARSPFCPTHPASQLSLPGTPAAQFWASASLLARATHCLLQSLHQGLVGLDADLDLSPGGLVRGPGQLRLCLLQVHLGCLREVGNG